MSTLTSQQSAVKHGVLKGHAQRCAAPNLRQNVKVRLSLDTIQKIPVVPYSEIYGRHPSRLKSTHLGMREVSSNLDPYTSNDGPTMAARAKQRKTEFHRNALRLAQTYRRSICDRQPMPWNNPAVTIQHPENLCSA